MQLSIINLLRPIGQGSYGEVWLARTVLGELRAVKIVLRSSFDDDRPYEREFEGLQKFAPISRTHPSQLAILHVGRNEAEGCFYYVMELADAAEPLVTSNQCSVISRSAPDATGIPGSLNTDSLITDYSPRTLRLELKRRAPLPPAECVRIGLALAEALTHLHQHDLVHRDIKPSNIIFVGGVPKLADIGLVTDVDASRSFVGTEGYLPPEGPGTPQADIYGLGKVLYELCTGKDRKDFPALPPDLRERPESEQRELLELNAVLVRACATDPRERYQSAQEMAAELALLQGGQSVRRTRGQQRLWSQVKKAALGLALLALVIAGVARLTRQTQRNEAAEGGPPSTNELANALCDKALRNLRGDNHRGLPEVYTNLHRAIALDPNFAKPYVGLLELHLRENMPGIRYPSGENLRTITQRLMELLPDSAAAHCGQSILNFYDWDYPSAEQHARRAVALDPNYELGHQWFGFMLVHWSRAEEARRYLEVARRLNPSKVHIYRVLGHSFYAERNYPRAIEFYRQGIGWEPHDLPCYIFIAHCYRAMGEYLKALDVIGEQETVETGAPPKPGGRTDRLRQAFAQGGRHAYWEEELRQREPNRHLGRALALRHLNRIDEAFAELEQCYQAHERQGAVQDTMFYLLIFPEWDDWRGDPRFLSLLERVGYTKVMPARLLESIRERARRPE